MRVERMSVLRPAEAAWIAALPCAVVLLAAIVWLGPLLGHALPGPGSDPLWPRGVVYVFGQPEPVKHGRFLVALLGPPLLAATVFASASRRIALRPELIRALVLASQMALVALLIVALLGQHNVLVPARSWLWPVYGYPTIGIAALLVVALLLAMRRARAAQLVARATRDTRLLRIACVALAAVVSATWLLSAVETDRSLGDLGSLTWTLDDSFAVLDGRTPLVDYHALYAQLTPYLSAGVLRVLGATTLAFTLLMTSLSLLALLAVYAIFRRVVRSPLLALALFLPMLAAGFLPAGPPGGQLSAATVFAMWPMRYGGIYLVAWLTARQLDGAFPRRVWLLSFVAGLVVIDNLEFGLPALAATVVALLVARPAWSWRAVARLAAEVATGVLGAVALFSLLTLVRAGELPSLGVLLEFPRIYGTAGYTGQPMPALGIHLVLYVTFAAAIGVAAVRYVSDEPQRMLTGMLAWSGVFGLVAGGYFAGRSDVFKLVALFSPWFLSLGLLAVVLVRGLAARGWRRPRVPELAVLLAFGLAACSFAHLPMPWSHVDHLRHAHPAHVNQPLAEQFVATHVTRGEKVAILIEFGHRIAYHLGIANVSPYSFIEAMVVRSQMRKLLDAMHRERAHRLFLPIVFMTPEQLRLLERAGFARRADWHQFSLWSNVRS